MRFLCLLRECQLKLSNVSARVRIVCGIALMTLGYSPIFFDCFQADNSSSFEICAEEISQKCSEIPSLLNLQNFQGKESLCSEMLKNSINYSSFVQSNALDSKIETSTLRTITKGEFAGAKIVKSVISSNFYTDARRLGVPARVVDSIIHTLSSKIDFRRSLRKGSEFEIIFDNKKGLLYSKISTKKNSAAVYMVKNGSKSEYFFEDGTKVSAPKSNNTFGQPLRGRLMISSRFGMRLHPVYKKYKFHSGVDLRANHGTPVMAICDGVVTRASYYSGYGKCVDIKHSSGYVSRYAHLSRCNVRVGAHVKKGSVIGRVGSTGTSTGSHLHLELAKNHKFLNPLSVKMIPEQPKGAVKNKKAFNATKNYVKRLMSIAE